MTSCHCRSSPRPSSSRSRPPAARPRGAGRPPPPPRSRAGAARGRRGPERARCAAARRRRRCPGARTRGAALLDVGQAEVEVAGQVGRGAADSLSIASRAARSPPRSVEPRAHEAGRLLVGQAPPTPRGFWSLRRRRSFSSRVAVTFAARRREGRCAPAGPASPRSRRAAPRARTPRRPRARRRGVFRGLVPHERDHLRQLRPGLQEVVLVEDEHDLLAPLPDRLEEGPLALGEGPVGRCDEQHQVRAGHELAGERLVLAQDGVRARRVHDARSRAGLGGGGRSPRCPSGRVLREHLGAVLEDAHPRGGRRDAFLENPRAQQRVDEGALARVELAHHDEQEGKRELLARSGERLARGVRNAEPLEARGDLGDEAARLVEEGLAGRSRLGPGIGCPSVYPKGAAPAAHRDPIRRSPPSPGPTGPWRRGGRPRAT